MSGQLHDIARYFAQTI